MLSFITGSFHAFMLSRARGHCASAGVSALLHLVVRCCHSITIRSFCAPAIQFAELTSACQTEDPARGKRASGAKARDFDSLASHAAFRSFPLPHPPSSASSAHHHHAPSFPLASPLPTRHYPDPIFLSPEARSAPLHASPPASTSATRLHLSSRASAR